MKLRKSLFSIMMGLSIVFTGLFVSCSNPSGGSNSGNSSSAPEESKENGKENTNTDGKENENTNQATIKLEAKNTSDGIEFTWGNLPENTQSVEIDTLVYTTENTSYKLFEIYDLETVKSVTDEYVTAGKEYQYRIIARNERENSLSKSEWIKIKANGGKGELEFNAEATATGIHISASRIGGTAKSAFSLDKWGNAQKYNYYFYSDTGNLDFTDEFVEPGDEYKYFLIEQLGSCGEKMNGIRLNADPLVKYTRYKVKDIKAVSGSGQFKVTDAPTINYDANQNNFEMTKNIQFSAVPKYWCFWGYYNLNGKGLYNFIQFQSNWNNSISMCNMNNYANGEYSLDHFYYFIDYGDYYFLYRDYKDSEVLKNVPQKVTITNSSKKETASDKNSITLEVTPEEQGIKLEWKNIPNDTVSLEIRELSSGGIEKTVFEIYDLDTITFVNDKYVTKDKEYLYCIVAKNEKGSRISSTDYIKTKATGGSGEINFSAQTTSDGIKLTGQREQLDSQFSIFKTFTREYNNSFEGYIRLLNNSLSFDFTDTFVESGKEYKYTIREIVGNTGNWNNGKRTGMDPVISYPRHNTVVVTPTGGSGEFRIINKPSVTYEPTEQALVFSKKPEFSNIYDSCSLSFYYSNETNKNHGLFSYQLNNNDKLKVNLRNPDEDMGEWTFEYYNLSCYTGSFSYSYSLYNLDAFENFPETVNLSDEYKFKLLATPTEQGIKLEVKNLPKEAKSYSINEQSNNSKLTQLFYVKKIDAIDDILDKYVDTGIEYTYKVYVMDENNNSLSSTSTTVKATGGAGERTFTAQNISGGIYLKAQKAAEDSSVIIYRLPTDKINFNREGTYNNGNYKSYEASYHNFKGTGVIDFTDKFVTAGKEYSYRLSEIVGKDTDDFIEYPRYKIITVTAKDGSGSPAINNNPVTTYDSENKRISFTTIPTIAVENAAECSFYFKYQQSGNYYDSSLFKYDSKSGKTSMFSSTYSNPSVWTLSSYQVYIELSDFAGVFYYENFYDISKLSGIQQTFTFE